MRTLALLALVLATLTCIAPAHAEPPASSPPPPAPAQRQPPTGEWGWFIVGSGLLVGGAITGVGLTIDCGENERACERHASLLMWTGIGLAGLSSAIGIAIVQAGRARVQVAPYASGGLVLRAQF